jgi:hypothetical protein
LMRFAGRSASDALTSTAAAIVKRPESIGRRYVQDLSRLDPLDMSWADQFMASIEASARH